MSCRGLERERAVAQRWELTDSSLWLCCDGTGIIGGSGLYRLDLQIDESLDIDTPWGKPSSPISIARIETDNGPVRLAFISRHGPAHNITPTNVPARANIAALKHLGCKAVVAFSAVGSLREECRP